MFHTRILCTHLSQKDKICWLKLSLTHVNKINLLSVGHIDDHDGGSITDNSAGMYY